MKMFHAAGALLLSMAFLCPIGASAQDWPNRPITMIIPLAPGGPGDILARVVADKMAKNLGQSVIARNEPAAGMIVGTESLIKSKPDGYTLGYLGGTMTTYHLVNKNPRFRVTTDLAGVSGATRTPVGFVGSVKLPVTNLQELIEHAKRNPSKLNGASVGFGSSPHLLIEYLNSFAGVNIVHIPYAGAVAAFQAVITGESDLFLVATPGLYKPHLDGGKVKVFAVTSDKREPLNPSVPTAREQGQDIVLYVRQGFAAPKDTPKDLLNRLSIEVNKALSSPDVRERLNSLGNEVVGSTPEQHSKELKDEEELWTRVIKAAGMEPR